MLRMQRETSNGYFEIKNLISRGKRMGRIIYCDNLLGIKTYEIFSGVAKKE